MKTTKMIASLLVITILLSGCAAYHHGAMYGSASLNQANFTYVKKNVSAKASAIYVLGIGGITKNTLVDEAKQKLMVNNSPGPNQALANVTVNFKSSWYFFFYRQVDCIISADVVEFR